MIPLSAMVGAAAAELTFSNCCTLPWKCTCKKAHFWEVKFSVLRSCREKSGRWAENPACCFLPSFPPSSRLSCWQWDWLCRSAHVNSEYSALSFRKYPFFFWTQNYCIPNPRYYYPVCQELKEVSWLYLHCVLFSTHTCSAGVSQHRTVQWSCLWTSVRDKAELSQHLLCRTHI